jgi:hypothetical protein
MADELKTKLMLGPGRMSFPHFFEAQKNDRGEDRYSTAFLMPPGYDTKPIVEALTNAAIKKFGPDRTKWPKGMRGPAQVLRDCADSEHYAALPPGWKFINCSSPDQPGIVDANLTDVTDKRQVYPGRWARITVNAYGYDAKGNRGVTLGLNNVQLLKHDEPLAGKRPAKSEFDVMAEEMQDAKADETADTGW